MSNSVRKTLLMLGAFCALAVGGSALAGAATKSKSATSSSSASSSSTTRPQRPAQEQLTGETAEKVKAAALAKVPGGTVLRAESGGHGGAAYHAHVRKSDGTEVVVLVNAAFEATSVETRPAGGRGDRGGPGHRGGAGGPGRALRREGADRRDGREGQGRGARRRSPAARSCASRPTPTTARPTRPTSASPTAPRSRCS